MNTTDDCRVSLSALTGYAPHVLSISSGTTTRLPHPARAMGVVDACTITHALRLSCTGAGPLRAVLGAGRDDVADLSRNPVDGFSAGLVDDSNVFEWNVSIMGPPDTL